MFSAHRPFVCMQGIYVVMERFEVQKHSLSCTVRNSCTQINATADIQSSFRLYMWERQEAQRATVPPMTADATTILSVEDKT